MKRAAGLEVTEAATAAAVAAATATVIGMAAGTSTARAPVTVTVNATVMAAATARMIDIAVSAIVPAPALSPVMATVVNPGTGRCVTIRTTIGDELLSHHRQGDCKGNGARPGLITHKSQPQVKDTSVDSINYERSDICTSIVQSKGQSSPALVTEARRMRA